MNSAHQSCLNLDPEKNDYPPVSACPQTPQQALHPRWRSSQDLRQLESPPDTTSKEQHSHSASDADTTSPRRPHHHPIEDIYPQHHGYTLFWMATLFLLSTILTLIVVFSTCFRTPSAEHPAPATENTHTQHLKPFQRTFINKLPWNFCFSIIWMFVIYTFQFIWDKNNMLKSWRYRLQALIPLLFNACLGTLFFSVVGWLLLISGVRPIVVAGLDERASGF